MILYYFWVVAIGIVLAGVVPCWLVDQRKVYRSCTCIL